MDLDADGDERGNIDRVEESMFLLVVELFGVALDENDTLSKVNNSSAIASNSYIDNSSRTPEAKRVLTFRANPFPKRNDNIDNRCSIEIGYTRKILRTSLKKSETLFLNSRPFHAVNALSCASNG